jgi:hypothetical protein
VLAPGLYKYNQPKKNKEIQEIFQNGSTQNPSSNQFLLQVLALCMLNITSQTSLERSYKLATPAALARRIISDIQDGWQLLAYNSCKYN